ncbi:hypothetical protein PSDVSF_10020 [Pseudodesulfovibrio sediminis]|uniref:Uncharacterized protein n=1 Tax=Pseudodesulfovibrio sediminis TaxID=2810563 RepID=A0ABN6ERA6_9BACT|nr:hypothetical protein PSDVSF_10020 [Pseudodesulfovibrio sediminis]
MKNNVPVEAVNSVAASQTAVDSVMVKDKARAPGMKSSASVGAMDTVAVEMAAIDTMDMEADAGVDMVTREWKHAAGCAGAARHLRHRPAQRRRSQTPP